MLIYVVSGRCVVCSTRECDHVTATELAASMNSSWSIALTSTAQVCSDVLSRHTNMIKLILHSVSCSWDGRLFGHNRHGPKIFGLCFLFWGRGAGSPSSTMWPASKPTSIPSGVLIHPAIWPQQIWAENWGLCPFEGGGAGSPYNPMWPGPKPTCMPSFILIDPTVWPQCTNVTDRQDRQDRQTTVR